MKFDIDKIPGELVTFHATDGVELQGFLVKAARKTERAVLNIHGLTGSFFRSVTQKRMIPHYLDAGYDFFLINTRGHGIITPMFQMKGKKIVWTVHGTGLEVFEDCLKDLKGAVDCLSSMGYKKIILLGHSTGCQKSAYYIYKTKDKRVSAVVLLGASDDYDIERRIQGKKWKSVISIAKRIAKKNPDELMPLELIQNHYYSAQRYLSMSDMSRVEARIFNYHFGNLKEFGNITIPILAVFGRLDQHRTKPVRTYLKQLERATNSKKFMAIEIPGAKHDFRMHEAETAQAVVEWLDKVV